jgi:hypothetical protein
MPKLIVIKDQRRQLPKVASLCKLFHASIRDGIPA